MTLFTVEIGKKELFHVFRHVERMWLAVIFLYANQLLISCLPSSFSQDFLLAAQFRLDIHGHVVFGHVSSFQYGQCEIKLIIPQSYMFSSVLSSSSCVMMIGMESHGSLSLTISSLESDLVFLSRLYHGDKLYKYVSLGLPFSHKFASCR